MPRYEAVSQPDRFHVSNGPFHSARIDRSRLQRQWSSYNRYAGYMDTTVNELLGRLNWRSLGTACIVDVSSPVSAPS
jgi:hypothetical protein